MVNWSWKDEALTELGWGSPELALHHKDGEGDTGEQSHVSAFTNRLGLHILKGNSADLCVFPGVRPDPFKFLRLIDGLGLFLFGWVGY